MASPAHVADARADKGPSDDETAGFIPTHQPATATLVARARKLALALSLVAGVVVAAAALRRPAAYEAPVPGQRADVGSALGLAALAERRRSADERARAIVEVLNEKPQEEIGSIVKKAMEQAGEKTLAKRRQMGDQKTFNQILADVSNQCTLQRPDPESGDGVYLAHDYNAYVYMDPLESGPTQWKITHAGAPDVYNLEAIVPGTGGSYLAHELGDVRLGEKGDDLKWKIKPLPGKKNEGLYVVQAVGALEGDAYLSREGKKKVSLSHNVGGNEIWKVPCVANQYERQAQRKANCAFNVVYAMQYVARSSLMVQASARTCPNSKGLLNKICAINALVTVASFSNLALAISDAASSCAESTSVQALCASGVEALIVSLSTIGAGGLITATACKPGLQASDLGLPEGATPANLGGPAYMGRRLFLGGGKGNFLGQCILDFTQVAWSLGSVGIAITAAVRDSCPSSIQGTGILVGLSQSACSMDIAAVIYAFGRISLFLALATIHCTDELNLQALCAGGVSALVAAAAALVVTGDAFYIACDQGIKVVNSGGTVPLRIGAAAEAGASRRLAALAAQALAQGAERTDVHKLAKDLGYNISNPLKLPTFDSIDSAMKVLEEFDNRKAEDFGVGEASLKSKFKSVEDMWKHVGVDMSDPKALPAAPAPKDESERFVGLMEPVLSDEDKARVAGATAPKRTHNWQWPTSRR